MRTGLAVAVLVLSGVQASAHRLDEYLQGTLITVEKNRVQIEMNLSPGVSVLPLLLPVMDKDADGVISEREQSQYAARVLRDLTVTIDGSRVFPRLISVQFPAMKEIKEGRGEIRLNLSADLPDGSRNRKLVFENHHLRRIAAYQVNCLVPSDPQIRVTSQHRNYVQSAYAVEYENSGESSLFGLWAGALLCMTPFALLLAIRFRYCGRA